MKRAAIIASLALAWLCVATPARAQGEQKKRRQLTTAAATCGLADSTGYIELQVGNANGGATVTLAGTWSGTISFFASGDGGATWNAVNVTPSNSTTAVTTATANGTWQLNPAAYTHICGAFTTATSGTVVATIQLSTASARSSGGGGVVSVPWINVTSPPYNAKCDNATNDTAAIQAAYNASINLNGLTPLFIPGFCNISGHINATAGVNVFGLSPTLSALDCSASECFEITGGNVYVNNLEFQETPGGSALHFNVGGGGDTMRTFIEHVSFPTPCSPSVSGTCSPTTALKINSNVITMVLDDVQSEADSFIDASNGGSGVQLAALHIENSFINGSTTTALSTGAIRLVNPGGGQILFSNDTFEPGNANVPLFALNVGATPLQFDSVDFSDFNQSSPVFGVDTGANAPVQLTFINSLVENQGGPVFFWNGTQQKSFAAFNTHFQSSTSVWENLNDTPQSGTILSSTISPAQLFEPFTTQINVINGGAFLGVVSTSYSQSGCGSPALPVFQVNDTLGNSLGGIDCNGALGTAAKAALVTTAANSDVATVTGATSSSHCTLTPTNALAATNLTTSYISGKAANAITVTHVAAANMDYDIFCTEN